MSFLEKRGNLWYASLKVPKQLRAAMGKTNLRHPLGTPDKRIAAGLAGPIVAMWKAQLREAAGEADAVLGAALWLRKVMAEATAARDGDDAGAEAVADRVVEIAQTVEKERGEDAAREFAAIAFGEVTPSHLHFEEWKASITHLDKKTQDQSARDVERLTAQFPTLEAINAQSAQRWIAELQKGGASYSSIKRMLSFWRSYWRFLTRLHVVKPNSFPFSIDQVQKVKTNPEDKRKAFPAEDVPKLWRAAGEEGDAELANLIQLGAYTGARIEELCALKAADVGEASFRVIDAKTRAGVREVPIHKAIAPLMEKLKATTKDGFILSGLSADNKYGVRSDAIGKRFGRFKTRLGYDKRHVFHSLRKTFINRLQNAKVPESVAADIVGHDKPTITYGLYGEEVDLSTKAAAVALVAYPGAD